MPPFYFPISLELSPVAPVGRSVLDCFSDVLGLNFRRSIEIGNGARDFKNAVVCASTQTLLLHRAFKQALAVAGEFAIRANLASAHLGIAEDAFACRSKAVELHFTCAQDTLSNRRNLREPNCSAVPYSSRRARRCGCRFGPEIFER